jgi:hypothetical protein
LTLRRRLGLRRLLPRCSRRWSLSDDRTTGRCLSDRLWCWNGLYSLSSGNGDAARDYRGGRHAEACARDEIAAGDNRSSALFSCFRTDRVGRLVAC